MAQREIKFRAWDKEGQIMSDMHYLQLAGEWLINDWGDFVEEDVTLEQYVEMYDEEDISIYDGDVIKVWDNGIGQVVFENGVFKVDFKDGRKYPLELWWQDFISGKAPDNPYTVLGNIHENLELLEAE